MFSIKTLLGRINEIPQTRNLLYTSLYKEARALTMEVSSGGDFHNFWLPKTREAALELPYCPHVRLLPQKYE